MKEYYKTSEFFIYRDAGLFTCTICNNKIFKPGQHLVDYHKMFWRKESSHGIENRQRVIQ